MLKQPAYSDDLFEKSSMSFGEHLEELRKALAKAFLWLAIGTCIGLVFAENVVEFIAEPLERELNEFYLQQTAARFKSINNTDPPEQLLKWMDAHAVMPERVYVDPTQLARPENVPAAAALPAAGTPGKAAGASDAAKLGGDAAGQDTEGSRTSGSAAPGSSVPGDDAIVWKELAAGSLGRMQPLLLMRPIPNRLMTYDMLEGFLIWLKAGLLVGAIIASPGIFYHIWEFLAAGLYPHERRYVYLYLPLSVVLFVSGVCLAFFVIFQLVINFLLTYNSGMDIDFAPRLKDYISFALFLPLGFGIAFQLPLAMLALNRFGIISVEMYKSKWRIAVLAIAFLSMILTPADAYSMVGMFVPLTILYFLGIVLCVYMPKGPGLGSQAFDPA